MTSQLGVEEYLQTFHTEVQQHIEAAEAKEPTLRSLSQAFVIFGNRVGLAAEITVLLTQAWRRGHFTEDELKLKLKYVFRDMLFVGNMATIEYQLIKVLRTYPQLKVSQQVAATGERNVRIGQLVRWLKDLINDAYLWDFCVKFRNDIVHFDAVARQSMKSPIIDHPISMVQGKEATGVLRSLISLSQAIEGDFFKLIMKLQ